jgi:pyridoxal biosynthesis lyase PdxS
VSVSVTTRVKRGMAEMLKGGVIMDVVTPEQAKIAEDAGVFPRGGSYLAPVSTWS